VLLSEDCSKAVIKKSLNLGAKGYKVVKKQTKINPSPLQDKGWAYPARTYLYSLFCE
jgi:hypothetical protein